MCDSDSDAPKTLKEPTPPPEPIPVLETQPAEKPKKGKKKGKKGKKISLNQTSPPKSPEPVECSKQKQEEPIKKTPKAIVKKPLKKDSIQQYSTILVSLSPEKKPESPPKSKSPEPNESSKPIKKSQKTKEKSPIKESIPLNSTMVLNLSQDQIIDPAPDPDLSPIVTKTEAKILNITTKPKKQPTLKKLPTKAPYKQPHIKPETKRSNQENLIFKPPNTKTACYKGSSMFT